MIATVSFTFPLTFPLPPVIPCPVYLRCLEQAGFDIGLVHLREIPVEAVSHIVVTPFTEWTITLNNPEEIDLSNLTSVELKWEGTTIPYTG
jgi:hypothetical protein